MSTEGKKPAITRAGGEPDVAVKPSKKQLKAERKQKENAQKALKKQEKAKNKAAKSSSKADKSQKSTAKKAKVSRSAKTKVKKKARTAPKINLKRPNTRYLAALTVVGLLVVGYGLYNSNNSSTLGETAATNLLSTSTDEGLPTGSLPGFGELLPPGIAIDAYQYDGEIGVFFYKDEVGGVIVVANQQPLPDEIRNQQNGVKNLALSKEGASAIAQVETSKGPVYIASLTNGRDVAIFDHGNVLMFIESSSPIPPEAWIQYIDSLN